MKHTTIKTAMVLICLAMVTGCSTRLYTRDIHNNPVKDAKVVVTRFSVAGEYIGDTDSKGIIKIPWGLPDIELISVCKDGYIGSTLSYSQLDIKPYIAVLIPVEKSESIKPLSVLDLNNANTDIIIIDNK